LDLILLNHKERGLSFGALEVNSILAVIKSVGVIC